MKLVKINSFNDLPYALHNNDLILQILNYIYFVFFKEEEHICVKKEDRKTIVLREEVKKEKGSWFRLRNF